MSNLTLTESVKSSIMPIRISLNVFLRFEVQFRTKFMQENHLMTTGVKNINNVLRMGEVYWRDILNRFDEQLGRTNFDNTKEREGLAKLLISFLI